MNTFPSNNKNHVPVQAVQELGASIGIELPDQLLDAQCQRGYRWCNHWDGALHELGHLVLNKSHANWIYPDGALQETSFIDRTQDADPDWVSFRRAFSFPSGSLHLHICNDGDVQVPNEWTVQSWCFEVAKAKGWLEPDEAEDLINNDYGSHSLRMFWSSHSSRPFSRYHLAGNSKVNFDAWTLKRQHRLQLRKLKRFGVDVANGFLVPTRTGRAAGPWIELVDALGKVHQRIPRTYTPEAAPFLMALWNWWMAFGSFPADMSWDWFFEDNWLFEMKRRTDEMNSKLVDYCRQEMDRLKKDVEAASSNKQALANRCIPSIPSTSNAT